MSGPGSTEEGCPIKPGLFLRGFWGGRGRRLEPAVFVFQFRQANLFPLPGAPFAFEFRRKVHSLRPLAGDDRRSSRGRFAGFRRRGGRRCGCGRGGKRFVRHGGAKQSSGGGVRGGGKGGPPKEKAPEGEPPGQGGFAILCQARKRSELLTVPTSCERRHLAPSPCPTPEPGRPFRDLPLLPPPVGIVEAFFYLGVLKKEGRAGSIRGVTLVIGHWSLVILPLPLTPSPRLPSNYPPASSAEAIGLASVVRVAPAWPGNEKARR